MRDVNTPPISWTRPVPTKLRTPSTSDMILETNSPDFVLSKKRVGKYITFFWTRTRSLAMRCWASTLNILVNKKEVMACIVIAPITHNNKFLSISVSLFMITSSIKYWLAPGSTKLEILLRIIKKSPIRMGILLGQMIVLKTWLKVTFEFAMPNKLQIMIQIILLTRWPKEHWLEW